MPFILNSGKSKVDNMKYDFDTVINRRGTNCVKWDLGEIFVKSGFAERFDENTISAFTADMDFRCAQPIIDAIKEVADHGIFGYTTLADCSAYYDAVINWFESRYGWKIKRDWIVYMNGTVNALKKSIEAFTEKEDGIIIMRPVYFPFTGVIESTGRKVINCQLADDGQGYYTVDFEKFEECAADSGAKAFILCNPHNPVGRVWTKEELNKIIEICSRHQILILADEIHGDLTRKDVTFYPIASLAEDDSQIVTFTAANKTFNLAGLEITNVVISDEELRSAYRKTIGNVSPSPFAIAALIAAYTKCDDWLEQLKEYLDGNVNWTVQFLKEKMPEVICRCPEGTYIMWMDFRKTGYTADEIRRRIYGEANILLESGKMFDPDEGAGFERICVPMSRQVLWEAFRRIEQAFQK